MLHRNKFISVFALGLFITTMLFFPISKVRGAPTIVVTPIKLLYGPGIKVTATYSGAPGNFNDWIGLFKVGAAPNSYINYQYLKNNKSGILQFILPETVGSYELRMWEKENVRIIAVSAPIVVSYGSVTVVPEPAEIKIGPGKKIKVNYTGAPGFSNDWVGLFEVGAAEKSYLKYIYTKGLKSGMVEFDAPEKPGQYEFRFWTNESVKHLATSKAITIQWGQIQMSYSLSPPDGSGNRKITVTYSGAPGYQNDWIGLFKVGAAEKSYIVYQYIKGKTSGTLIFDCPKEKGPFEFRMWGNEWTKLLGVSQSFTSDGPGQPGSSPFVLIAYPGDSRIYLEWTAIQNQGNLIGYNIYRKSPSEVYKTPITDFPIKGLSYLDTNVENGETTCYYAKPVYKGNKEEGQSNEVCVVPGKPKVEISFPENVITSNGNFTFTGKVPPGSTILVNGKSFPVNANGTFTATVTLKPGVNTIKIVVTGKTGDVSTLTRTITYKPPALGKIVIVLKINQKTALVNNVSKTLDVAPFIDRGRTFVPFRFIGESLGAVISFTVDGGGRVKTVTYKLGNTVIVLTIGSNYGVVNGKTMKVDVPPQILQGRTVVPLRFVTENLGCKVDWDGEEMKITITYPQ